MFEFLKRFKIRDRAGLRRSPTEPRHTGNDSDPIDAVLSTIITQEILLPDLSSDSDPDTDTSSADAGTEIDAGAEFDSGGGESGGGGADGDW